MCDASNTAQSPNITSLASKQGAALLARLDVHSWA